MQVSVNKLIPKKCPRCKCKFCKFLRSDWHKQGQEEHKWPTLWGKNCTLKVCSGELQECKTENSKSVRVSYFVTLPSSHRPPHLSGQTPLLRVDFGVDIGPLLLVFNRFWPILVKNAKNPTPKSPPLEGVAPGAWWRGGGGLWLEVRSQS